MPELRYNEVTGDWVIVAPERAARLEVLRRADTAAGAAGAAGATGVADSPDLDPACPFCPGNEEETPADLWRYPGPDEAGVEAWEVRVVPNKYPALSPATEVDAPGESDLFRRARPGVGHHEVIIETPNHNARLEELSETQIAHVMEAYRVRFAEAAADQRIRHVVIFRNYGPMANASLEHPHSQLVALPLVPPAVERKMDRAERFASAHGGSLLLDMLAAEVGAGTRVVDSTDAFVTFVPYAAAHPYELWVTPGFAPPRFDRADERLLREFGHSISQALLVQRRALSDPDYNMILHTPPLTERAEEGLPWYAQLIPRLEMPAGFETGSGVYISVVSPEDAAERLREARAVAKRTAETQPR